MKRDLTGSRDQSNSIVFRVILWGFIFTCFGTTDEVASLGDLCARFEAFGIPALRCDGHDAEALAAAITRDDSGPRAIVLDTVKGKGVSFMENEMAWHYLPLDEVLYARAVAEVEAA